MSSEKAASGGGDPRRATGREGERLARSMLEAKGWRIRDANWRCKLGELDLVAEDGDCLVLVEVRTRRGDRFGSPEASVGRDKQARLRRLGAAYVQQSRWPGSWRIDVVAIELGRRGEVVRAEHYRNAVGG
ncbi:MAG: YraN family protein [Anaerolineae bacterium]